MNQPTTFTELRPMLWTKQLHETVDFYTTVLGFTCAHLREDWGWASLIRDGVGVMITSPKGPNHHEPIFRGSFYFYVSDVDALWNDLKDRVKVCYGIENFEWGMREFAIYDNNGYILQFGKEVA